MFFKGKFICNIGDVVRKLVPKFSSVVENMVHLSSSRREGEMELVRLSSVICVNLIIFYEVVIEVRW